MMVVVGGGGGSIIAEGLHGLPQTWALEILFPLPPSLSVLSFSSPSSHFLSPSWRQDIDVMKLTVQSSLILGSSCLRLANLKIQSLF